MYTTPKTRQNKKLPSVERANFGRSTIKATNPKTSACPKQAIRVHKGNRLATNAMHRVRDTRGDRNRQKYRRTIIRVNINKYLLIGGT